MSAKASAILSIALAFFMGWKMFFSTPPHKETALVAGCVGLGLAIFSIVQSVRNDEDQEVLLLAIASGIVSLIVLAFVFFAFNIEVHI